MTRSLYLCDSPFIGCARCEEFASENIHHAGCLCWFLDSEYWEVELGLGAACMHVTRLNSLRPESFTLND